MADGAKSTVHATAVVANHSHGILAQGSASELAVTECLVEDTLPQLSNLQFGRALAADR